MFVLLTNLTLRFQKKIKSPERLNCLGSKPVTATLKGYHMNKVIVELSYSEKQLSGPPLNGPNLVQKSKDLSRIFSTKVNRGFQMRVLIRFYDFLRTMVYTNSYHKHTCHGGDRVYKHPPTVSVCVIRHCNRYGRILT